MAGNPHLVHAEQGFSRLLSAPHFFIEQAICVINSLLRAFLPKPYSWDREFDPQRDSPPVSRSKSLHADTVRSLARCNIPIPPVGEFVYRQTREIEITGPGCAASGRTHKEWVYYHKNGKQFVRAFVQPRDAASSRQLEQRLRMKQVQMGWHKMSQQQREEWDAFAGTIKRFAPFKNPGGRGHRCHRLYQSAQLSRLAMGLPLRNDAPTRKVAQSISAIELVPAPAAGQIAFRVFYTDQPALGLRLMVEMTRPMPSTRRSPRENELTRAGMNELDSYFPLVANGATYVLDQPRHAIAPRQRFGMQVTVISKDGIRSRACFVTELFGTAALAEPAAPMAHADFELQDTQSQIPEGATVVRSGFFSLAPATTLLPAEIHRQHREMFDAMRNRVHENPIEAARRAAEAELYCAERKREALEREQHKAAEHARRMAAQQLRIDARKAARARTWLALLDP